MTNWATIFHIAQFTSPGDVFVEAPWGQPQITALASTMRSLFNTHWRPLLGNTVVLTSTEATDLSSEVGFVGTDNTNVTGSLAGTACTAQVAQCVSWREALHYRGGHLRNYLPPPTMSQVSSTPNTWASTHVTAVETAANAWLAALVATVSGGMRLQAVGVHRTRQHATLSPPEWMPITSGTFDNRIDTQRRRLGRDV